MSELTQLDKDILKSIPLKMTFHLNAEPDYLLVHRNDELGFTRIVRTPRSTMKGVATFEVDGSDKIFTTFPEMVEALKQLGRWPEAPLVRTTE